MRIRSRLVSVLVALVGIVLTIGLGCNDPVSYETVDLFPIAIGNSWEYSWSFTAVTTDTMGAETTLTDTGSAFVEVIRLDTLPDSLGNPEVFVFQTDWLMGNLDLSGEEFYNNTADGFYSYGYNSPFIGPPRLNPDGGYFEFKDLRASSLPELLAAIRGRAQLGPAHRSPPPSVTFEEPPIREIAYPLKTGTRWSYRSTEYEHPWDMDKEIITQEIVNLPVGRFSCYKIAWYWDMDDDGEWDTDVEGYDYLGTSGYVSRIFHYGSITARDENNNIVGTLAASESYTLRAYDLK